VKESDYLHDPILDIGIVDRNITESLLEGCQRRTVIIATRARVRVAYRRIFGPLEAILPFQVRMRQRTRRPRVAREDEVALDVAVARVVGDPVDVGELSECRGRFQVLAVLVIVVEKGHDDAAAARIRRTLRRQVEARLVVVAFGVA